MVKKPNRVKMPEKMAVLDWKENDTVNRSSCALFPRLRPKSEALPRTWSRVPAAASGAAAVGGKSYIDISFLPLTLKNSASAITVEKVRMAEIAEATPSLPRMTWL